MPKQATKAEVNNFVKGLISEASPLNFPPNCSIDEANYELNRNGTRSRRLGFDLEDTHTYLTIPSVAYPISDVAPATFKWTDAGGRSGETLLAVQFANVIKFFDLTKSSLSTDGLVGTLTLDSAVFPKTSRYSFGSVDGKLVVAAGIATIAVVTLGDGYSFSVLYDTLKTRDVWGVEGLSTEGQKYEKDPLYRGINDKYHSYNLRNQSWGTPRKDESGTLKDPVTIFVGTIGKLPSNSETVWPGLQYQPVTAGTPFERIYPNLYNDALGADIKSPKGYFVIDVINRGASRVSEVTANETRYTSMSKNGYPDRTDYTEGGCSVISEFAGRIFYSGFSGKTIGGDSRSPTLNNYVFFSQLVKSYPDFFKCYQEGDPTSRDNNDIVDTDGGFIRIAGADKIIKLINLGNSLVVIATNGVWAISGGNDDGFKATNYRVDKVTTFGGISEQSIVAEKARVFYWSEEGINVITRDQMNALVSENITDSTIKTLYQEIPATSRESAIGAYDNVDKKVRWTYIDSDGATNELVLDLMLGAFYRHKIETISGSNPKIVGVFQSTPFNTVSTTDSVYSGTDLVMSSADEVIVGVEQRGTSFVSVKYLCLVTVLGTQYYTFGSYKNTSFRDWERVDGTGKDAKAYMLTGSQIAGDSSIQKQVQYLTMHFRRTEDGYVSPGVPRNQSSCLVRMQWDWSNTSNSSKWSALKQAYRYARQHEYEGVGDTFDTGFEVITTKNLIRGRGRSFALYIETEPYKDCQLLGWSVAADGNRFV